MAVGKEAIVRDLRRAALGYAPALIDALVARYVQSLVIPEVPFDIHKGKRGWTPNVRGKSGTGIVVTILHPIDPKGVALQFDWSFVDMAELAGRDDNVGDLGAARFRRQMEAQNYQLPEVYYRTVVIHPSEDPKETE